MLSTVRAELALPLENRGHGAGAVARGVEETALALGIGELLERATHELSGGELQRVALGAALAGRPRLVLLDEPTSQLDPVAGDELVWLLRRLNEEWGTTIVLVEHRLERCLGAADRVLAFEARRARVRRRAARLPRMGGRARAGARDAGRAAVRRAGLRPPPSGVKEARATLRAHGLLAGRGAGGRGAGRAAGLARGGAGARPAPRPRRAVAAEPAVASGAAQQREPGRPPPRPAAPALRPRRARVPRRVVRALGRARRAARRRPRARAGRARRAHGPQRRRQVDAAAPRQRAARADARARRAAGRVALLLQNPNDYFLADRVGEEVGADALERAGLTALAGRHPRDLSGGERQRLALAIVCAGDEPPAALCLDEPTRGMDRAAKGDLAADLRAVAAAGSAVLVATHDPEFAALDRRPRRAARRRAPDRRRPDRRAAQRRLVLRDRDGADRRRRACCPRTAPTSCARA